VTQPAADAPKGVKLVSFLVALLGLAWFLRGMAGKPGVFGVLVALAGTGFFLVTARGLARLRAWAWYVTCVAMLGAAAATFVRVLTAVDAHDSGAVWERILLLVGLSVVLRYLGREKVERLYRPGYFEHGAH